MAQGDKLIKLEGLKEVYQSLKSVADITNEAVFGTSAADFPLQFENGTYEFTAVGKELIKYYGGGYDLTRKVIKSTTFNATCRVHITAKEGYVFVAYPAENGVIVASSGYVTEYTMYPGRQYGMILRSTGGTDDISGIDVSDIIEIEYESNADAMTEKLGNDLRAVTDQPENICYVTPGAAGRVGTNTYFRQSAGNKDVLEFYGKSNGLGNINAFNGSIQAGTNSIEPTRYLTPGKYTVYFTRSTDNLKVCRTATTGANRTTVLNGSTVTAGENGLSVFIHIDSGADFGTSENPSTISIRIYRGENVPDVVTAVDRVAREKIGTPTVYVAADGNDDNNGSSASPVATVNRALAMGAKTIYVSGGVYRQRIDMSYARHGEISILNCTPTLKAVFMSPDSVIAESETAVSGYTKVYSAPTNKTFDSNNLWIYQDGVPDVSTEITAEKRMPEQRGQQYRCMDTRIVKASAQTLEDALTEIENAAGYKWYIDSGTLYFSRPTEITADHPLCGSFSTSFITNKPAEMSLRASGIDVKYMTFNVNLMEEAVITDCSAANVFGSGAFVLDKTREATFIRCEASRCVTGTNGDGFNGHSDNTGDTFAHQTTATFIECWSHDNRDDGVSLHERSEFTVIGGLYEQNPYGGGVTPANGSHCTCYGVYARDNGDGGFLYMNNTSAAEGGVGGQIKCINCVSETNGTAGGFKITATGNKGIMIGCKAIGERSGYYVSDAGSSMVLTDCGAANCTNAKGGQTAVISVVNTSVVE